MSIPDKFYVVQYDYERGYDDEDDELVSESRHSCDLREAVTRIADFCADHEDWRYREVILYPADHYMDMQGIIHTTHVVIGSENERHFNRLSSYCERKLA
jgi:hypothetical protein